jgi:prepilin-type N-terminal cleavage/methylation domain-containing protein
MTTLRRASGYTMIELVVAMVVMGIVGAAIVRLIVAESRSFQGQDASQEARKVSRAAVNLMTSELRMLETGGGVAAASPTSITVRAPYAIGIVCNSSTISTMPVDSLMFAQATFSGYAWRDTLGAYTYVPGGSISAGSASNCTTQNITTLPGGKVVALSTNLPADALVGNPVMLYQTIRYFFGPSVLIPGRTGLFRQVSGNLSASAAEEIAAPFDSSTSRFKFYVLNVDTSQAAVPSPLSDIRGIELDLGGASRHTPRGRATPKSVPTETAVFFQNRLN